MKSHKKTLFCVGAIGCALVVMAFSGWYFGYKLPKQRRMQAAADSIISALNVVYDGVFGNNAAVEDMCHDQLIKPGATHTLDEIVAAGYVCKCVADSNRTEFVKSMITLAQSGQELNEETINNLKNMPKETKLGMIGMNITVCSSEYEELGRNYFVNKYGVIK